MPFSDLCVKRPVGSKGISYQPNAMDVASWYERAFTWPGGALGLMVDSGWAPGTLESDVTIRNVFHSSTSLTTGLNDPEIDAALDREQAEGNLAKRRYLLQEDTLPLLVERSPPIHCLPRSMYMPW